MQHRYRFRACLTAAALGALLASTCPHALADDGDEVKPLALRKIMRDMGENMQVITAAISREDWRAVATAAPLIADHPQPPLAEKMRILAFVGSDAGSFREHDKQTHRAARALDQVATRGDGKAVISAFATLQETCLACHQRFRQPFQEYFNEER